MTTACKRPSRTTTARRPAWRGQFYLFLIGADDNYLAHPIFAHLIGTDIKAVVGSDGQRLGEEIAQATEQGIWVEYLWPHPVTLRELPKVAWAVRHEGLIFASGYYVGGSETETPPWQDADHREYTVQYVNRAIERYERDGLESMLNYYNSVASFEGEWYLFATDANDVYHVHPLLPHLIGTDIKNVVGSDGYQLGKELAKAEEGEGVWVEYLWPHPVTLQEVPKVGYAVRHDGMLFASGYYPQVEDPAGHTQAYVQKAIDYYKANGLDATIAHYSSQASVDGQWNLTLADADDTVLVAILSPGLVGRDLKTLGAGRTRQIGRELAAATEEGRWVSHVWPNTRSSETLYAHNWAIRYEGLLFVSRYYDDQPDVPVEVQPSGRATRKYVMDAIAYYGANGRDATEEHYNSTASIKNQRYLILLDDADATILAMSIFQGFRGEKFPFTEYFREIATEAGVWTEHQGFYLTETSSDAVAQGPMRSFIIRRDGLIFMSGHSVLSENVAAATQDYVARAIAFYQEHGLDATIERYNSLVSSLEGHFYLFLIGPDDLYLAHPIFPGLIGTDIKNVTDRAGDPLGERIALATEQGIWVEYRWPNPITRIEEPKTTWAKRHDGMIFASGYYEPDPDAPPPAWQNVADPEQYTEDYVNRAIARYEEHGLESMLNYYNSVASFEGQWYLFATDENDIYHVHPLLPHLIGTDINDVVGDDGYELGKALAAAPDGGEGVWVDYLWPHPVTLQKVPKRGYAARHDGMLFASGYYPEPEDPAGEAQAYVQKAMDYFDANGAEATLAHYSSPESIEGQYVLLILDEQGVVQVFALLPDMVGWDVSTFKGPVAGEPVGEELLKATEEGHWFDYLYPNVSASEVLRAHQWAIRHKGYIFSTAYFVEQGHKTDDQLTQEYVEQAIAYYDANGREATIAYYSTPESVSDTGRRLRILRVGDQTILASPLAFLVGGNTYTAPGTPIGDRIGLVTAAGTWYESATINPATGEEEPRRNYGRVHDGLIFVSGHAILRDDLADFAKAYVQKAMDYYDANGQDATVAYYDSKDSVEGQYYLFLIGADDIYLAHPIFPNLKNTDIKDVKDTTGYELGKEIAKATTAGHWVDYLWPHPVTRIEEPKSAWVVRHDGLIFASGYYTPDPNAEPPAWKDADPREYTVTYVNNAIERYKTYGLQGFKDYYNSVGSFEGQWYLFVTDSNANDTYIVHGLFRNFIRKDIKNVSSSDNPDLGKEIAAATAEGVWVEYLWPHPLTLQDTPKVAYAKRYDGLVFASGYYPAQAADPAARTKQYVADAIAYYDANGQEATIAHYNNLASIDGQWYLTLLDENLAILVLPLLQNLLGQNISLFATFVPDFPGNDEFAKVTQEGQWFYYPAPNPLTAEEEQMHMWVVRHDGLLFGAGHFTPK